MGVVELRHAGPADARRLEEFLTDNALTTVGLRDCLENFLIAVDENGSWVGVAGYEMYGESALLRSVAVDSRARNLGHGRTLVQATLANAKNQGIHAVYLMTETAERYFSGLGFDPIERDQVEPAVKNSPEFAECCGSARVMRKTL
jgi:amino-acid N-acetyltransferase